MPQRLPPRESLTVEFKNDRSKLPDRELIEVLVCLSNAEGGELWLGVEDDGTPTGLHAEHRLLEGLAGMVAARTSPSLNVRAEVLDLDGVTVARTRGRSYTLSASLYQAVGDKAAYTRQAGFTPIQHEQMVLNYVQQHGQIQRAEVKGLCRLPPDQAAKLLKRMTDKGALIQQGDRRWSVYKLG